MATHFEIDKGFSACGRKSEKLTGTAMLDQVDCKSCLRSTLYAEAVAKADAASMPTAKNQAAILVRRRNVVFEGWLSQLRKGERPPRGRFFRRSSDTARLTGNA